jgi:hypothetical protein
MKRLYFRFTLTLLRVRKNIISRGNEILRRAQNDKHRKLFFYKPL